MMREGIQNVPGQAAGIGDGEGRDLECPRCVGDGKGRDPSVFRSKLLIKHFPQLCPVPF